MAEEQESGGLWQMLIVLFILMLAGGLEYQTRKQALQAPVPQLPTTQTGTGTVQPLSPLGDLTIFRTITQDTLTLLQAGKQAEATTRIGDLEYEWDNAQARLKAMDKAAWTEIDGKIDTVLRELRAVSPKIQSEEAALEALLLVLR